MHGPTRELKSFSYDADEINGNGNETRIIECNLGARIFVEIQVS